MSIHYLKKPLITKLLSLIVFYCLLPVSLSAQQNNINFSNLSAINYKDKIIQLEKYTVPKKYIDKSSQAWYAEILTDRNKSLLSSFKENNLIDDTLLLKKCNSILNTIMIQSISILTDLLLPMLPVTEKVLL